MGRGLELRVEESPLLLLGDHCPREEWGDTFHESSMAFFNCQELPTSSTSLKAL